MARVHNFSAGPAALPQCVLREAQDELLDYAGTGMSVLEMSHRSEAYRAIIEDAEATLRRLLGIPPSYRVLFLQGGATLQFAGIPLNLMRRRRAGYVVSGNFAKLAWREGCKYGDAEVLASSEATNFDRIPELDAAEDRAASGDLDYVYICQNNTIFGTQFHTLPDCAGTPLVADVSSCFLSGPLDIERYGLLFAGAQKNAGPAGVTVVIVREDLIANGRRGPTYAPPTWICASKPKRVPCTTRPTPLASTCAARSSAGSSRPTGSSPWRSATEQRPTCSTAPSTIATSSRARRTPKAAP